MKMPEPIHPLTHDHLVLIREGMEQLEHADRQIEQAVRAGIDVADYKKQVMELRTKLQRLKTAYFPGQ